MRARGVNAHGTVTLPMPATVILDAARTVRWIDVRPDYSTRTEPQQVIDALDPASQTDRAPAARGVPRQDVPRSQRVPAGVGARLCGCLRAGPLAPGCARVDAE